MLPASKAHAATLSWVRAFVCGLGLCPWAKPAETLVVVSPRCSARDRVDAVGVRFMRRQAELLLSTGSAAPPVHRDARRATVVCAFTDDAYEDVGAFAKLWRAVEADLAASAAPDDVVLLAFHPERVDSGPGCVPEDASDPGHFSVRSPLPTLQLLRATDVQAARDDWSATHGGWGALGLLTSNKQKLQKLGSGNLRARIEACRHALEDPQS